MGNTEKNKRIQLFADASLVQQQVFSIFEKFHSRNLDLNLQSDEHFTENTQQVP